MLQVGDLKIDLSQHKFWVGTALILLLARNAGSVLTHKFILEKIGGLLMSTARRVRFTAEELRAKWRE